MAASASFVDVVLLATSISPAVSLAGAGNPPWLSALLRHCKISVLKEGEASLG